MQEGQRTDHLLRVIPWLAMLAYITLSVIFFRERMSFLDGPHFLIEMINNQGFFTPFSRYASYVTQILPVIGIRTGMENPAIMLLYSLNISLFYMAVFAILDLLYKNRRLALTFILFLWVITYDSFFMPVSELPVGIAFLLLLIAHFQSNFRPSIINKYLLPGILVLHISCSHPLLLFPLLFGVLSVFVLQQEDISEEKRNAYTAWFAIAMVLIIIRILLFGNGEIEKVGRLQNLMANYNTFFLNQPVNHFLKEYLSTTYLQGTIATGSLLVILLIRKQYRHAVLFLTMSILFVLVYVVSHPEYNVRPFIEIYFLVIAFFIAWYWALLIVESKLKFFIALAAGIILIQTIRIIDHSSYFKTRNEVYSGILEEMKEEGRTKVVIPLYRSPMRMIGYEFGAGYESLLLSMLEEPGTPKTFTFVNADSVSEQYLDENDGYFIVSEWYRVRAGSMHSDFKMSDNVAYQAFYPTF